MEVIEMTENEIADGEWTAYELSEVSLGDKRLNWRLLDTASKLAARASVSINQACEDWADTKATYRLFANKKTTAAKILAPHQERTKVRMASYEWCLAIHLICTLDEPH